MGFVVIFYPAWPQCKNTVSRATFLSAIGAICVGNVLRNSTNVILPIKSGRFKNFSSLYIWNPVEQMCS